MLNSLLLATDLDRTVLPNGSDEESSEARSRFTKLVERPEVILAYVSGRGESLLKKGIEEYSLPLPAYAIGDVGTTIFVTHDASWKPLQEWQDTIAPDWKGNDWNAMQQLFEGIEALTLQEDSKQNTFKLSYYAPENTNHHALITQMQSRLDAKGIDAALIWSIDEPAHTGLMDVLPKSATKVHALQFLRNFLNVPIEQTVFCGDSGNDMPALVTDLNAVLVANARDVVKKEAQKKAKNLYIAQGNFLGMNGNYSAGVLEGVAHYFPETVEWMQ